MASQDHITCNLIQEAVTTTSHMTGEQSRKINNDYHLVWFQLPGHVLRSAAGRHMGTMIGVLGWYCMVCSSTSNEPPQPNMKLRHSFKEKSYRAIHDDELCTQQVPT